MGDDLPPGRPGARVRRRFEVAANTAVAVGFFGAALIPPFDHWSMSLMAIAAIFLVLAVWGLRDDR